MEVGSSSISNIPKWLEVILGEKFFNSCLVHELERKNEENTFCLDCCLSLCIHCLPSHQTHKHLQIRRYIYKDVLRLKDADKLLNCSFVQSYRTNKAKVVFLNQRSTTRSQSIKDSVNCTCILCHKSLQRPNLFCSISCKVQHMISCSDVNSIIKYQKLISKCESSVELIEDQKTSTSHGSISASVSAINSKSVATDSNHTSLNVSTCSSVSSGSRAHRRKGVPQRRDSNEPSILLDSASTIRLAGLVVQFFLCYYLMYQTGPKSLEETERCQDLLDLFDSCN